MPNQLILRIEIKRPSWSNVSKAYREINEVGKKEYDEVLKESELHDTETYRAAELIQAQKRYEKVGGQALSEFNRDSNTYINTCALQVSYALNYGGMPLMDDKVKLTSGTKLKGKNDYKYYTGVSGIKELLLENWKRLKPYSRTNNKDFYKVFYNHKKEPFETLANSYGNILNEQRVEEICRDNLNFFNTLQSLGIKGIVTMNIDGWGDAEGHTTLWNGNHFLDDTNYLNDGRKFVFVRELCFWELK
ncbi:hypothetical protein LS70_009670 [Helicobacter sp. MIT 11-5569]|uniref:type VI secretion system amidase effector protein Tae4 n=1 Tax=Helicobacter sp. MIT 11-5569 TaxID=1548151 RepID=UPI0009E071AA|nr:type VI secretion system amidase effector protein Tae4 [Helicobacter sp. MIT 11-5569]TLD79726.1 hypothetical protein LS70_009670 [Helicobacter sp. MIT 11-5569]